LALLVELEKLTNDKAENYLSPSIHGQVKIKGKFIRDENGKLVPILVRTYEEATPVQTIPVPVTIAKPPEPKCLWGDLKQLLGKLFIKKRGIAGRES